jgi:predicted nucleotidyltransferase component of viral defense system
MSEGFLRAAAEWLEDGELFRQALERTARDHGFAAGLIEKDFFCSLVLATLAADVPDYMLFKGGTCLSKVYTDFYRLSEDLDFSIPVEPRSARAERRRLIEPIRALCSEISIRLPQISVLQPLRGANLSKQYIQTLGYHSRIGGTTARIRLEFGLREPALMAPRLEPAGTLLVNPLTGRTALARFPVRVMAEEELWAEKVRAALCRREPAIRDFFDLDYALRTRRLDLSDPDFIVLAGRKLVATGTDPGELTEKKRAELECQIETDLKPVLRARDLERFDLNRVWTELLALLHRINRQ